MALCPMPSSLSLPPPLRLLPPPPPPPLQPAALAAPGIDLGSPTHETGALPLSYAAGKKAGAYVSQLGQAESNRRQPLCGQGSQSWGQPARASPAVIEP